MRRRRGKGGRGGEKRRWRRRIKALKLNADREGE